MLVAALVFKAIFSKEIKFSSAAVTLLTLPLIHQEDLDSVYPEPIIQKPLANVQKGKISTTHTFDQLREQVDELIISMRFDPEAVKSFRNMIRAFDSTGTRLPELINVLEDLGFMLVLSSDNKLKNKNN